MGKGEEGVMSGDDWQGEHEVGEDDAAAVRHQQQRQHIPENRFQFQILW